MKAFEPGEKLFLIHTGEEVTVTRVENNRSLVFVELDGDEIPVDAEFLSYKPPVVSRTDKQEEPPAKSEPVKTIVRPDYETGVSIAFLPLRRGAEISRFRLFFVNGFLEEVEVKFQLYFFDEEKYTARQKVKAQSVLALDEIDYDALNEAPSFAVRVFGKYNNLLKDISQKIKPKNFFGKEAFEPLLGDKVFRYILLDHYPEPPVVQQASLPKKQSLRIDPEQLRRMILETPVTKETEQKILSPSEVDLHAEAFLKDYKLLSAEEILHEQIRHFEKSLDRAIAAGLKKFHVIHGKGKGKLKKEIHQLLERHPRVRSFHNEFNPRYDFGATEVLLK